MITKKLVQHMVLTQTVSSAPPMCVLSNSDGKWDVWKGRKPKYDWSRLDINATTTFKSTSQLCSTNASSV